MIFVSTFFTDTMNTVDGVIGHFVQTCYQNLIAGNKTTITLLFTLYVTLIGYRFLTRTIATDLMTLTRHMILMLMVYGLIMNWALYNTFFYTIFTNEPGILSQVVINSSGQFSSGESIASALDAIFNAIANAAAGFFSHVSWANAIFIVYGLLVLGIGGLMFLVAMGLFIYAKLAMAIGLALGPIFIVCLLWDSTQNYFAAWLRKLVTMALIPIIISGILALMLSIINVTLPQVNLPPEQLQFFGILPFLGLSFATTGLLLQARSMASSLGGGITLSGISKAAQLTKSVMEKSGINALGGKAAGFVKGAASKAAENMSARRAESKKRMAEK